VKNHIVENYENYREEDRLTTNHARRIEYNTTIHIMDELIGTDLKILDCAAGTGIYAFYLADKGNEVTATDITPRHIDIMNHQLKTKNYSMNIAVMDAADMSIFEDESFDVVLNMGPFYHLISEKQRMKCMSESVRVLKKGGILFTAYIPRFYVYQFVSFSDSKYIDKTFADQIMNTGVMRHDDDLCFWTDAYFSTKEEMESLYSEYKLEIIDHFAQDGLAPMFSKQADSWTEKEFKVWCDYHLGVCREASALGASNHVMIVGKKL